MAEALEGLIERLDGHVRYKYMPAAVRTSLEEAAQALRLLGEVEKALECIWLNATVNVTADTDITTFAHVTGDIARSALDKLRKGMGDG